MISERNKQYNGASKALRATPSCYCWFEPCLNAHLVHIELKLYKDLQRGFNTIIMPAWISSCHY